MLKNDVSSPRAEFEKKLVGEEATWRSSDVSDERTKANGTEVDRGAPFVQCWVVYKRGPRPTESRARAQKYDI